MKVERIKVADLHADPANVRRHPGRNLDAIRASLARFGQQRPVLVDANNVVRAGNATLEAARALGWDAVDAVRTKLGASEATAYAIADNRTAELAEWDIPSLAEQLKGLEEEDFELAAAGFTAEELDALMGELDGDGPVSSDGEAEPDLAIPESHVRMVSLFLDITTFDEFHEMIDRLSVDYGSTTPTDTVMECLRRATAAH